MILQVGVKIILKNKEGEYLLLRRSAEKYPGIADLWDIPGGRIDPGSSLLDNLKREMMEETGLTLGGEPKLIAAQDILKNTNKHVVRLTYIGKADGEVKLDANEHEFYKWFDWEEILKLEDLDMYFKELLKDRIILDES
ncbi:NUDIX hydrolase [Candidatus Giovannonibacteria bacterium]|nr:NUDIX hydrolase [Candidatus Giovannonibacteria bacterium]